MTDLTQSPATELRVVSLLPSATEIVTLVGGEPNLVGISHECDWPRSIQDRPRLTSSKVDLSPSSLAIDLGVRDLLKKALAVYDIDTEQLARLAPDFIVTQDLCDVCAVSYEDVERACNELLPNTSIVNLHPTRWSEVMDDIQKVADAFGVSERGRAEVARIEEAKAAIAARSAKLATRPNVLTIEWIDPVMIGGTWMPELVEA
ncbi:MAG: iron complex transport system substrate-binding protein, partial [Planctomycetota bacterium]